jgi:hypothetical protein
MKANKYFYLLAAAALTVSACSSDKDQLDEAIGKVVPQEGEAMTFAAKTVDGMEYLGEEDLDGQSSAAKPRKIGVSPSDFSISHWYTNDKISISDGTLNYTFSPSEDKAGPACSFSTSGNTFVTDGTGDEGTFYAFYPQEAVLSWNGPTVTTMIWTEQDYTENAAQSGVMGPYIAASATTTEGGKKAEFKFGHICSVIDVDISGVTGETVDAVSIYANSQNSLAGNCTYNFNDKIIRVNNGDNTGYSFSTQSEMVRVSNVPSDATTVRFYVLPVAQPQGVTITVHTTAGNYYTKKSSNSLGRSSVNGDYMANIYNGLNGSNVIGGGACLPYYKKYKFGSKTASNVRNMNWMAMIPGNVKFNHLSLPGTHDAATSGCTYNAAKCQAYTIAEQLQKGCRALDLRPYYNSSTLENYHGIFPTGVTLTDALNAVKTFLTDNPTETVFILIAQEGDSDGYTDWQNLVWSCLNNYTDMIATYGWNGNLNPCRGKMVVIFRNTYTGGTNTGDLGCGKVGWGSSFNDKPIFTGNGSSTRKGTLRYQDEYETNKATKLTNLETMLTNHIAANETNEGYTFVNNANSTYGQLTPNVSNIATEVNTAILSDATFTEHTGKFCIMFVDFLFSSSNKGDRMFELIHKQNYKYVYKNRTRCKTTSSGGTDTGADIAGDEYADNSEVFAKER